MEFLQADGLDEAIIGIDPDGRLVYSQVKVIEILCKEMSESEAHEYYEYNIACAYMGNLTPIWVDDSFKLYFQ